MDEDYARRLLDWLCAEPELPVQRGALDQAREPEVTIPAPRVPERG